MLERELTSAIRESLQTEKAAMDFYAVCETMARRPEARAFFQLLASEEREHARMFHSLSKDDFGSFDEMMQAAPDGESSWLAELRGMESDFSEHEAMLFALEKERRMEDYHRRMEAQAEDPVAKAIFALNARETRNHLELIEAEYSRIMGMPHEGDVESFRG
jgi:rubrerythrin